MSDPSDQPPHPPLRPAADLRTPVSGGLARAEAPTRPTDFSNTPTLAPPSVNVSEPGALVGHVFGDFELVQEIGRGGMGVVYKAVQRSLEREVALKLLLAEHASNPHLLRRFLDEARAAAGLNHPNIVQVYQVGECIAGPFFVMELIDGPSLEVLLTRTLPVHWVVSLLTTVADAVHHAHGKGIIHRDLKPGNVMLHQQKRPVVMDFGIAKVMGRGSGMTQPGAVIGTPAYMPPEQAGDHPDKIGPHSDVYSLGAILYTLLTGKVPFDEGNPWRTMLRVVSDELPPPVRTLRSEVPVTLERITMKALEKDASRRYASARDLADDLRRFRATMAARSTATARPALPTVVLSGAGGKQLRLFNPSTVLGRAQECDVVLKSSEVSKRHCRILISTDQVIVEDLGSVNGTFVNGKQIERARLGDGDELDLAGVLSFQVRVLSGS